MPTHNNIELRSEEIQELLTKIPSVIIRWGITALFLCLLLVLSASYFIKIPEKVNGDFLLDEHKFGKIYIPAEYSGIIKKGQPVIIHLDNFPADKFGSISTIVDSLSYDKKKHSYVVYTPPMNDLTTNFGIQLHDLPFISGNAAVIIDEKPVIRKILPFLNF